ncbi:nucleotidyltransferase family protein [Agromyces sp. ISL-38]|uniref:nucleotidyltransferase family protein n=1 Tax=Agromyces sp. ISL-38 TaxID=2819107 RepID=UPI001BECDBF2|nr:nucleotidyltransferase family protein [Agromyces sp. ISL-38]MBT2498136.1 nucleotidyltransferase family protein [Agromyces sp. ISL-38]MBT2518714.1 nucleotidyltransferase family protein [Streptomyces sp. ISL-90]
MTASLLGVLLAAGAGTRMGRPKALVRDASGVPWVVDGFRMLRAAGCDQVVVVLGAEADAARALVPAGADVVVAADWERGLSASLRAGLAFAAETDAEAVLVSLVDLAGLPPAVGRRVIDQAGTGAERRGALTRAVFVGRPGHPVLIGRDHWTAVATEVSGDTGAGAYLARHDAVRVECADLSAGLDRDR